MRQERRQFGAQHAGNDAHLAARRSWQKLTERDDIRVGRFIEPFTTFHEFTAEVAQARDWPAEARNPSRRKTQSTSRRN
jgi:hypothetical protein